MNTTIQFQDSYPAPLRDVTSDVTTLSPQTASHLKEISHISGATDVTYNIDEQIVEWTATINTKKIPQHIAQENTPDKEKCKQSIESFIEFFNDSSLPYKFTLEEMDCTITIITSSNPLLAETTYPVHITFKKNT